MWSSFLVAACLRSFGCPAWLWEALFHTAGPWALEGWMRNSFLVAASWHLCSPGPLDRFYSKIVLLVCQLWM